MNERWKVKNKPASLDARFEFEEFGVMRAFLDELADEADKLDHHPNVSFGRTHASVIIYSRSETVDDLDLALVKAIDEGYDRIINPS